MHNNTFDIWFRKCQKEIVFIVSENFNNPQIPIEIIYDGIDSVAVPTNNNPSINSDNIRFLLYLLYESTPEQYVKYIKQALECAEVKSIDFHKKDKSGIIDCINLATFDERPNDIIDYNIIINTKETAFHIGCEFDYMAQYDKQIQLKICETGTKVLKIKRICLYATIIGVAVCLLILLVILNGF